MKSSPAWLETAKSGAKYTVRARCPQCGRKHITVFRLRHVSDSFFWGTEAMPEVALVIFLAKLIDPIAALPALVAGYFCRTWWQVVISAAAVGIVVEMILVLFQQTPEIHQGRLLMGVLAAGVWSNLAFAIKTWRVKRSVSSTGNTD